MVKGTTRKANSKLALERHTAISFSLCLNVNIPGRRFPHSVDRHEDVIESHGLVPNSSLYRIRVLPPACT